jgi:hypothetical protein
LLRRAIWGALLVLPGACRDAPPPAADPAPPAAVFAPAPAVGPSAPTPARLCTVLASVVASETDGFARLRGRRLDAESWLGAATLPGTERCTIEGAAWPRARYLCVGPPIGAEPRERAGLAFDALAREVAQCLDKPIWFPRTWQQGERFEFAMGEQLQAWTDRTTSPPSQVVLKVQQDAGGEVYRVKLNLEAVP